jgi:hypothetical protein
VSTAKGRWSVTGGTVFDLTNGWEGTRAGEHIVVVTHLAEAGRLAPEASDRLAVTTDEPPFVRARPVATCVGPLCGPARRWTDRVRGC